jgi:putative PIN family toxin of toxin-antitoxin system
MRAKRFVLDNNIWISYFLAKQEQTLIDFVIASEIEIFICDELIAEFIDVAQREHLKKFMINKREAIKTMREISVHFTLA